jgi:hypothetical protein
MVMPNWNTEFANWYQNNTPLRDAIAAVVTSVDYGKNTQLRKDLITQLIPFYMARIAPVGDFDTAWARQEKTKGMFASETIAKAITHDWLHKLHMAKSTGQQQQQQMQVNQLAAVLLNNFKDAVAPVVLLMEKKSPPPAPRVTYLASTFYGMAADISLSWDINGVTGFVSPGQVTPNGTDGVASQDAEMKWKNNYTNALLQSITNHPIANFPGLRLELHVKARPCHYCGPQLNQWRANNPTIGAIPMFAFTYSDDQNGFGDKNVYRLDSNAQNGTKFMGKWA